MTKKASGGRIWIINGWRLVSKDGKRVIAARIREEDVEGAICRDPNNCVVARAIERHEWSQNRPCKVTVHSSIVTVIPLKQEDGVWIPKDGSIHRYSLSKDTAALIRHFDKQETYPVGVLAEIRPVVPSNRIGARPRDRMTLKVAGANRKRINPPMELPTRGWVSPVLAPAPEES